MVGHIQRAEELGKHLGAVLDYCEHNHYPALTSIVVEKGEPTPSAKSLAYFQSRLGNIDFPHTQQEVFSFDWFKVPEFRTELAQIEGHDLWLSSLWGFTPDRWRCLGFSITWMRESYIKRSKPGAIVFIYNIKSKGLDHMRGNVVGTLEVSYARGTALEPVSQPPPASIC